MSNLLPPNATSQEQSIDDAIARIGSVPVLMRDLWNADTCPADLLPWLAWAFGCDEWDTGWSEEAKRNTIRESIAVQRKKGSVWSIKRAIALAGYGDSELVEGNSANFYDGTETYNGYILHGDSAQWAKYRFILERPISNEQADQVRRILDYTAPARCELIELVFVEAANLYNGLITYDGTYNYGVA